MAPLWSDQFPWIFISLLLRLHEQSREELSNPGSAGHVPISRLQSSTYKIVWMAELRVRRA
jgi:hypothetical protein